MVTLLNGILSRNKIGIVSFHLNNREARKVLWIQINNTFIINEKKTTYLGDKVDGSLIKNIWKE